MRVCFMRRVGENLGIVSAITVNDWPVDYRLPVENDKVNLTYRLNEVELAGWAEPEHWLAHDGLVQILGRVESTEVYREYVKPSDLDPKWVAVIQLFPYHLTTGATHGS